MGPYRVTLSLQYTKQKETSNILTCTLWVQQDSGTPNKPTPPQLPTFIINLLFITVLSTIDYTDREEQAQHIGKNERCNINEYSELGIDATKHISDNYRESKNNRII